MITAQHWQNFDRLVSHLRTLPDWRFDYYFSFTTGDDRCAGICVEGHAVESLGMPNTRGDGGHGFCAWLGVTVEEAGGLWHPIVFKHPVYGTTEETWGSGRLDALRRLAILETRYARPSDAALTNALTGEAAFLADVRRLVSHPQRIEVRDE